MFWVHPYLEDQRDACWEERHENKVIGQNRHAAKTTHDLQLRNAWRAKQVLIKISV